MNSAEFTSQGARPLIGGQGDERHAGEPAWMTAPDPGTDPVLSPALDAEQLALLCRYGQAWPTTAGQVLFGEGDRAYDFFVVLSG